MKNLVNELGTTKADVLAAVTAIPQGKFNTVPFEGSWTAAQVCDHVLKSLNADVLYGSTSTTDRPADLNVQPVVDMFMNFETKMRSPDFILPTDKPLSEDLVLRDLETTFDKLISAAKTLDLSLTCLDLEFPTIGYFTRLEFLWFFVVHTKRHIFQLNNVAKSLA